MQFEDWIEQAYTLGASDLHLEAGTPIVARIRGQLQTIGALVTDTTLAQVARELLGGERWLEFTERGSADLSLAVGGIRLRANFFRTIRGVAAAIRLLAPSVKDLRVCNLHKDFRKLIEPTMGLIIISGPTGSGKSTTLAGRFPPTHQVSSTVSSMRCARIPTCSSSARCARPRSCGSL